MGKYYIFSTKELEFGPKIKVDKVVSVVFNIRQSRRLFGSDFLAGKELLLNVVMPVNDTFGPKIFQSKYYSDCNHEIFDLLTKNKDAYGYPSKHLNMIIGEILSIVDGEVSLKGDSGWSDLKNLFEVLRKTDVNYVVLRKYENLPNGFVEDDHDIDILCEDKLEMILATGATKRNIGISSYQLLIGGDKTDFDIRFVGDNYLDPQWAREILDTRKKNERGFFVMSEENQFFSIMYHCLTQKKSVSKYYLGIISELSQKIFGERIETSNLSLLETLAAYMKAKAYTFVEPGDISVMQNKQNIKLLKNFINESNKRNERIRNIYIKTPYQLKKIIPSREKQKLYDSID